MTVIPFELIPIRRTNNFLYILTVIGWAVSVKQRIIQPTMQRMLLFGAYCIIFLFMLRLCKFDYYSENDDITALLDDAYYIPVSAMPLTAFLAALCSGSKDEGKSIRKASLLFLPEILFCVGYLTNGMHGLMRDKDGNRGILYFVTVIWAAALSISTFVIIIKRCRVSAARKLWYIPVLLMIVGIALMTVYYVNGGAIEIGEIKLYNFQDVVAFLFIAPFEGMIQIGIIPSSSGYKQVFGKSHLNAAIIDSSGKTVIASSGYTDSPASENVRVNELPISGGSVRWTEDISVLARLESELENVTEVLDGENDLIRCENELLQERVGYEIKNRLYDDVAEAVRAQSGWLRNELSAASVQGGTRERLVHYAVVGVYIKRLCMMTLAAYEHRELSSGDLTIAIHEAFAFMMLSGRYCEVTSEHEFSVPAELMIAVYMIFEDIIEGSYDLIGCCGAEITDENGFMLKLSLDIPELPDVTAHTNSFPVTVTSWYEDDTAYITITRRKEKPT